jgi:hypothetical protein
MLVDATGTRASSLAAVRIDLRKRLAPGDR